MSIQDPVQSIEHTQLLYIQCSVDYLFSFSCTSFLLFRMFTNLTDDFAESSVFILQIYENIIIIEPQKRDYTKNIH